MSLQTEEDLVAICPEILEGPKEPEVEEPEEPEQPKEEVKEPEEPEVEEPKEPEVEEPKEPEVEEPEEPEVEEPKEPEEQVEEPKEPEEQVEEPKEPEVVNDPKKAEEARLIEPSVPKITPLIYKPKTNNYDSDIECDPFSPFDYGSNEFSINRDQKQEHSKSQSLFSFISKKLEWIWK